MQNSKKIAVAVGASALLTTLMANAALPTEAAAAFTTLEGNVTDVIAAVWGVVVLSVGGFTLIRLFKKGAGKAV